MFQHLATTRVSRLAYGELTGWQFYPIRLPNGFALPEAWADALRAKGVVLSGNALPNNSIVLVKTGVPLISNYDILWVNGTDIKIPVAGAVYPNGLGSRDAAVNLENALEKYSGASFERLDKAMDKAREMWAAQSGESEAYATSSSAEDAFATSDVEVPSKSTAAPQTGYYTDSGGYAWYYNAAKDYMEAVAAPKGAYTTQPRFSAASGASQYEKMKGVLTASAFVGADSAARAKAVANATKAAGIELPQSARGAASPAPAPNEVVSRGAKQQTSAGLPAWVWWTGGTVAVAGLAALVVVEMKKRDAARA